jgi:hypothetical protein
MPVGGRFEPHYWADGQTNANWAADIAALQTLKKNHIQDLYLSTPAGLPHVDAAVVQKLIDYLDANGFRYGLEIGDHPKDPLIGYVIKPSILRSIPSADLSAIKFAQLNGITSALYAIASMSDEDSVDIGDAVVDETSALVPITASAFDSVVLLYPQQIFDASTPEGHLPDLWQGYDNYRDRLLTFFSRIHLGKGFRFFIDPFNDSLGMNGDIGNFVPTSDGFHLEYEAWLERRYKTVDDLNRAWGIKQRDIPDFVTAARCIPLWNDLRGVPTVYDPIKHVGYGVINKPTIQGRYWQDLSDFKVSSVRGYMNGIANVLKEAVADVPVVFKASASNQLFVNDSTVGGFDGLAMEAFGHGGDLQTKSAAPVYAMAEESAANGWVIASDTAPSTQPSQSEPGYGSSNVMVDDWNALRDCGARGIFADYLQRLPVAQYKASNLASMPDDLHWMADYAGDFARFDGAALTQQTPILWYPTWAIRENPGIRRLDDGVWWLPSYRAGQVIPLGSKLRAYALDDPDGALPTYVVWSPHNAMAQVNFTFGKDAHPIVVDALGNELKVKSKGGVWTVPVGDEPTLIKHVNSLPLPLEVVDAAEHEAEQLVSDAESKKIPIVQYKDELYYAKNSPALTFNDIQLKFGRYQRLIDTLGDFLRPYAWIEGESSVRNSFDALVPSADASGGAYLSLDNPRQPPMLDTGSGRGYSVTYKFTVNAAGRYAIWFAGSRLDTQDSSPFTYAVDDGVAQEVQDVPADGHPYGGFSWSDIGEVTLDQPGKHSLTIVVHGPRSSDGHYALSIDAICLSSVVFHPDGTTPPRIDAAPLVPVASPKPESPQQDAFDKNVISKRRGAETLSVHRAS